MRYGIQQDGDRWQVVDADGNVLAEFGSSTEALADVADRLQAESDDTDVARERCAGFIRAMLVPEGVMTSDNRQIDEGALTWREPPLPYMHQTRTEIGHFGAELAGFFHTVVRTGNEVWGYGQLDDNEIGWAARELLESHERFGISVDLGRVDADVECEDEEDWDTCVYYVHEGEVMGATGTPFPAFAESYVELDPDVEQPSMPDAIAASAAFDPEMPMAPLERAWTAGAAQSRVRRFCTVAGALDATQYGLAHLCRATDDAAAHRLMFADVIGGALTAVPRGIMAAAAEVANWEATGPPLTDDLASLRATIDLWYARMREAYNDDSIRSPWDSTDVEAPCVDCDETLAVDDVVVAAAVARRPPNAWFNDPQLDRLTPLTVEGRRVYGHIAGWGQCHTGRSDVCVVAPRSSPGYPYFCTGSIVCEDGNEIAVGQITLGTGHADTRLNFQAAVSHYDNTGHAVADVAAGEDAHGIWIAGALRDGVDPGELRAASPSGDWRMIGGRHEMLAVLAVNVPGFPIVRARAGLVNGRQVSLVAAGVVPQLEPWQQLVLDAEARITDRLTQVDERVGQLSKTVHAVDRRTRPLIATAAQQLQTRVAGEKS